MLQSIFIDTNLLLNTLVAALEVASQKAAIDPIAVAAVAAATTNIWVDLAPAIVAVLTSIAVWVKVSAAEKKTARLELATALAAKSAENTEKIAADNTVTLGKVLVDVNSGSSAMKEELKDLRRTVLTLSEEKATSDEKLKRLHAAAEADRIVKERSIHMQPSQSSDHVARVEKAAEKTEAAAEDVGEAAEKTEVAISALTDSEVSKMILKLTTEMDSRKRKLGV